MENSKKPSFIKRLQGVGGLLFFDNGLLAFFAWSSLVVHFLIWAGLVYLFNFMGESVVIVRYNAFLGIDQSVDLKEPHSWLEFYRLALFALFLLILNWLMAIISVWKSRQFSGGSARFFACQLFLFGGFVVQIAAFIPVLALLIVNN